MAQDFFLAAGLEASFFAVAGLAAAGLAAGAAAGLAAAFGAALEAPLIAISLRNFSRVLSPMPLTFFKSSTLLNGPFLAR